VTTTTRHRPPGAEPRPLSDRERRTIVLAITIALIGACFSFKIVDRLAVSNLAQILSLLILLTGVSRLLRPKDVALWVLTAAGVLTAAWAMLDIYGYSIQWQYSLFYGLTLIWVLALIQLCRAPEQAAAVLRAAQVAIPFIAVYLASMLALDLATGDDRRRLGFDDKSHASVYACVLAFAALRVLKTPWRLLIALALFVVSLLTISRLPFIFAPGFLIAFFIEYRKVRHEAKSAIGVFGVHLLLIGAVAAPIALAGNAAEFFLSFDRVFSSGGRTDASTQAHLLLLQYAAELKFDNLANLLFGVTPGGFASVVVQSGIDVSAFAATDPRGYTRLLEGVAPMHSSTGTILLEFPLWIGLAYLGLMGWCVIKLFKVRETVMALMLGCLFIATTFYSSVTELYFSMAIVLALAAVGVHRDPKNPKEFLRAT
jgi:hypothetical protein